MILSKIPKQYFQEWEEEDKNSLDSSPKKTAVSQDGNSPRVSEKE